MKQNIAIIYGGRSGEHEVSCVSAASVLAHLDREKYEPVLIGVTYDLVWYLQQEPERKTEKLPIVEREENMVSVVPGRGLYVGSRALDVYCAFPLIHGTYGEDGTLQGLLEHSGIPYVGTSVLCSAIGMDKDRAKAVWIQSGLPVLPYLVIRKQDLPLKQEKHIEIERLLSYPLFVKPARGGSSVGISRADNRQELEQACLEAVKYDDKLVIEQGLSGREIECAVLGLHDEITVFPAGEVASTHTFYDYQSKYHDPDSVTIRIPAALSEEQHCLIQQLAKKAYRAIEGDGFARVDFFFDETTGAFYINEINTLPGFTSGSMYAMMAEKGGMDYKDLISHLVELAIKRHTEKQNLCYKYQ
ncbi:D-alanine--D-alanine ligase family protein [Spirochaetia bacterium 38H-sp]|uniref:D-alanine--D-alanine ligase n=1 Tax=Rarispira pelagica TaxID=3141764 RepID=A0ABU9UCP1_9SPIR